MSPQMAFFPACGSQGEMRLTDTNPPSNHRTRGSAAVRPASRTPLQIDLVYPGWLSASQKAMNTLRQPAANKSKCAHSSRIANRSIFTKQLNAKKIDWLEWRTFHAFQWSNPQKS